MDDKNVNPLLDGEIAETPTDSPSEIITPDDGTSVNPTGAENLSPEEADWNSLSGSAQERFRQVIREKNALKAQTSTPQPAYKTNQEIAPEAAEAVRKLSEVGMATKDDVESTVDRRIGNLIYNFEIEKLSNKYSGQEGLPAFSREEYEEYVSRNPQYRNYAPEDVYQKMYSEELFDYCVRTMGPGSTGTRPTPSLRPTRTQVKEESLTPEVIEQKLQEPGGREWYERNLEKINKVLGRTAAE